MIATKETYDIPDLYWYFYEQALKFADENQPTVFSSRIDGAVMAAAETYEE